jgi:hypothetical protein
MATNLTNLIVPQVFGRYIAAERDKINSFVKSGAAQLSPQLSAMLAGGAKSFTLPFWKQLSGVGIVPSTDYEVTAGVQKVSAGSQIALRMVRAVTPVAVTDIEGILIGEDPVAEAVRQFAEMHNEIRQTSLMAMLASLTSLDSADVGLTADLTYTSAGTELNGNMIAETLQAVWGDNQKGPMGMTIVTNSLEYLSLQKDQFTSGKAVAFANAIDVGFGTFLGATIIVDDTVPAKSAYIIKRGGLAFGSDSLPTPFEMDRVAGAGNGGGADVLHSRDLFSYHVAGTSYTGAVAGDVVTDAELGLAANWTLVKDKKFCGVAKLVHA